MELIIAHTGVIRCLYGEELDLAALGTVEIRRASRVEFGGGGWTADLAIVGGPVLGPFARRSDALAAERLWLEDHGLPVPPVTGRPPLAQTGNMTIGLARRSALLAILIFGVLLLNGCDEDEVEKARRAAAQRQAQVQAQLAAEQAQRVKAEEAARAAQESRNTWITALGMGGCAVAVIVLLVGIHIGSRVVERYKEDRPHA